MRRQCWLVASVIVPWAMVSCSDTANFTHADAGSGGLEAAGENDGVTDSAGAAGARPAATRPQSAGDPGGAPDGSAAEVAGEPSGGSNDSSAGEGDKGGAANGGAANGGAGNGGTVNGGAGNGGTVNGGAGNSALGGQSNAGGGQASGGQAGTAGQAGAGGQPPPPPAGEACITCGAGQCGDLLNSCRQNPECAPWLTCVSACDSTACSNACDATYAAVARVYDGVYNCLCQSCGSACAVADSCNKQCVDDGVLPPSSSAPNTLAATGLYSTSATSLEVAPYVHSYGVNFPLWADGAGKDRYIFIPRCATIDTKDMDHWQFPVGTRLWKHFSVDGKLVETRMIHRYGSGVDDWLFATYGWSADQPNNPAAATLVLNGEIDANGTVHDIPDPSQCVSCHGKMPDKPLGFSAFQLSHAGDGLTMQKLSDWGWLTVPARGGFPVPGTPVEQAALGYLHGNCGGCHNSYGQIPHENPMLLRLSVAQTDYAQLDALRTTIGVPTINAYPELHGKPRIDPQAPANSAIYLRMSDRTKFQMPPLATKFADTDGGVAAVTAWINAMPKP